MTSTTTDNLLELPGRLSIIQAHGTLDWAYANFILASTAVAMDKEVELFFTFYGLECLRRDLSGLKITPLANPAMVLHSPVGPKWFRDIEWNRKLPDLIWTLPGMSRLATAAFKRQMKQKGQMPIEELRDLCLELGVKMTACQMTVDLLGYCHDDLIAGIDYAGAASYFAATPQQQSLFI